MDFTLSDEQRLLVKTVQDFAKKDSPVSRFRQTRATELGYDRAVWKQMGELGWLSIPFPESVGGMGFGFLEAALVLQELGRTLVPEPYIPSVILAGTALSEAGSPAQRAAYLQPMLEGDATLALAYAERDSRHDVSRVSTRAETHGEGFVLRGEKAFVLNGHAADHILVSARTAGDVADADGVSLFVVSGDAAGLTRTRVQTIDGQRAAALCLDGVKVGKDALVGAPGAATPLLSRLVDLGAAAACAEGAGAAEAAFEMTREYLSDRSQFGVKIGSFQVLQHRCVDMFIELQLCQSTMLLAALKADEAPAARQRAISTAKVQLTMGGHYIARQAVQLHGGVGVTEEHDVGLYFKRLHALAGLFGDEQHHLRRYAHQDGFEGADASA